MKINRCILLSIFAAGGLGTLPELESLRPGILTYDETKWITHWGTLTVDAGAGVCPLPLGPLGGGDPDAYFPYNWHKQLTRHGEALYEPHSAKSIAKPNNDEFVTAKATATSRGEITTEAKTRFIAATFYATPTLSGQVDVLPLCPYPPGDGVGCANSSENFTVNTEVEFTVSVDGKMTINDTISALGSANAYVQMDWFIFKGSTIFRHGTLNPANGPSSPLDGTTVLIPKGDYKFRASFIGISNAGVQGDCSDLNPNYVEKPSQYANIELSFKKAD